jgi:CRP-like cAMP-binding protein
LPDKTDPLELLIRKLELQSPLAESDRAAIRGLPYTLRTVEAGTYAIREGDPPTQCAVLLSGFAYRQKLAGDGGRQIISIHIPGEALDFQNLFLDIADHSVQMLTRGELAVIPRAAVQELARSRSGVGHAVLVSLLIEASAAATLGPGSPTYCANSRSGWRLRAWPTITAMSCR